MDERRLDIGDLISAGITSQPVPKGGGMSEMIDQVRKTIEEEIAAGWLGAEFCDDGAKGDDHGFRIRADGEDYWIVLGHRAIRQNEAEDVVALLRRDAQRWIDLLQERHCVLIGMADNYPVLRFCPD